MRIIDLTHPFTSKMPAYPGDALPHLTQVASIGKEGYTDHKLETTMHVGTHIDAPAHMIKGGKRIDELPLESFYGRGVAVNVRKRESLDVKIVRDFEIKKDDIVLFCTGFSGKYHTPEYFADYPVVTEALARELVERKVKMVGFDTPSPDRTPYTVHKIFLGAGIPIIENLTNLEALMSHKVFNVEAIPMRITADAAPARIVAIVE